MSKTFTLVSLAKTLKINAKVARRRLRTAGVRHPAKAKGWEFNTSERARVAKIIKG